MSAGESRFRHSPPWTEPINLPLGYTRETYEAELARRARIYANWGKTT